jgi:hypothetical protein
MQTISQPRTRGFMHRITVLVLVSAALVALVLLVHHRSSPSLSTRTSGPDAAITSTDLPAASQATLRSMAERYDNKDSGFRVTVLSGTSAGVATAGNMSAPSASVSDDVGQLAVMEGAFTFIDAHVPAGSSMPTGRYLSVLFSKSDPGMVLATSLGDVPPRTTAPGVTKSQESTFSVAH